MADNKLRPGSDYFVDAEFSQRRIVARPQRALPYEALFTPQAWSHHVHNDINPGTTIEVIPEDNTYWALLIVRSKNGNGILVSEIMKKDFGLIERGDVGLEEVRVEFGGAHKWRVVRISDSEVLSKHHQTEQEAYSWAASNRKKAA